MEETEEPSDNNHGSRGTGVYYRTLVHSDLHWQKRRVSDKYQLLSRLGSYAAAHILYSQDPQHAARSR
ncbi:hypothetical protein E2562_030516 [Oryza meyeriana var. granulata]|uniref:Uncharacterized protein n=1 Tax=Oryza meyeriana var. granulata TaxID=110450 RepID=A0A6G1BPM1_9ORYZ|nr:hypothetical protein E2562_030516 [Oryza meyeriana var. granulata]